MNQQQIAEDLGRKVSDRFEDFLQREMRLAQRVLDPAEQLIMMMKIARAMSLAAILWGLQGLKDHEDPGAFFDTLREQLDRMVGASKHEALAILPMVAAGKIDDAHAFVREGRK